MCPITRRLWSSILMIFFSSFCPAVLSSLKLYIPLLFLQFLMLWKTNKIFPEKLLTLRSGYPWMCILVWWDRSSRTHFFYLDVPVQLAACWAWRDSFQFDLVDLHREWCRAELSCNRHRIKTFNYHGSLTSVIPFKFQSHKQTSRGLLPAAHTSVQWWTYLLCSRVTLPAVPHTILVFTLELLFVSGFFFLLSISSRNMDF